MHRPEHGPHCVGRGEEAFHNESDGPPRELTDILPVVLVQGVELGLRQRPFVPLEVTNELAYGMHGGRR
jgi:hypothetical protein